MSLLGIGVYFTSFVDELESVSEREWVPWAILSLQPPHNTNPYTTNKKKTNQNVWQNLAKCMRKLNPKFLLVMNHESCLNLCKTIPFMNVIRFNHIWTIVKQWDQIHQSQVHKHGSNPQKILNHEPDLKHTSKRFQLCRQNDEIKTISPKPKSYNWNLIQRKTLTLRKRDVGE